MKIAIIAINKAGEKLARKLKEILQPFGLQDEHSGIRYKKNSPSAQIFNVRMDRKGSLKNLVKNIFTPLEKAHPVNPVRDKSLNGIREQSSLTGFNKYEGLIFIAAVGIAVRLIAPFIKSKLSDPAVVAVDTAGRFSVSILSGHQGGANRLAFLVASILGALPVITTGQEVHKKFVLGIGTRKGVDSDNVKRAIEAVIKKRGIGLEDIRVAATVDLKRNEFGLIKACSDLNLPLVFIPQENIRNFKGNISKSKVVKRHIGLDGVCEPCSLLAGRRARLILKKEIINAAAVAVAKED